MKHDVHLYATVRVKVTGVEASDAQEAMGKALRLANLRQVFDLGHVESAHIAEVQYAEEVTRYLVDHYIGDRPNLECLHFYNADGQPTDWSCDCLQSRERLPAFAAS